MHVLRFAVLRRYVFILANLVGIFILPRGLERMQATAYAVYFTILI